MAVERKSGRGIELGNGKIRVKGLIGSYWLMTLVSRKPHEGKREIESL